MGSRLSGICRGLGLAALCCGFSMNPASATGIASDSFDYPASSSIAGSGNANAGWSGNWDGTNDVTTPGLSYSGLKLAGNKITTDGGNAGSFRNLTASYGADNTTIWIGFLAQTLDTNAIGYSGVSLFSGTSENLFLGKRNGQAFWGFQRNGQASQVFNSAEPVDATNADLLVFKVSFLPGSESVSMYVNPTPGADEANLVPAGTPVVVNGFTFDRIRIQSGNGSSFSVDELRLGTTFADVAPAVPEPASLGLLGLGSLLLLRRRGR